MVTVRQLDVDENISVRGETLQRAIKEDRAAGKIPFYVNAVSNYNNAISLCCIVFYVVDISEGMCDTGYNVVLFIRQYTRNRNNL